MLKRAAFALAALASAPSPAYSQARPAPASDITLALEACLNATSGTGVDEVALELAGWETGANKTRMRTAKAPIVYGKVGNAAMIFVLTVRDECVVVARLEDKSRYAPTADEIGRSLKSEPLSKNSDALTWRRENLIVQLSLAGTPNSPSIRVGVVAAQEEMK